METSVLRDVEDGEELKKQVIKAAGFTVMFLLALMIISKIMNKDTENLTVEMGPATLPVVSMKLDGQRVNSLHGYSEDMQANYLRDTLTVLPENRCLFVEIDTFGSEIAGISYEVRSLDTTRLVENTQVYNYVTDNGKITAEFNIKDLIDDNREYILTTILNLSDGREVRYYTRILYKQDIPVKEQLAYVMNFHNKTFDKSQAKELVTYLESNEEGDNSSFHYVNIHSNFNQITWGELNVKPMGEPEVDILEMDASTASVKIRFLVSRREGKNTEIYTVEEFFRIRYTQERIYLLDYERIMNQIFSPEEAFANDKIMLGITGSDIEFMENTDGSVVAFVQENALYSYVNSENRLARLFSFYDEEHMDIRTIYGKHDMKILSVDEAGNVRFLVYGYMNRGRHEGKVGVSVYYYDSGMNAIEEEVYLPYDKSYQLLKENIELLSYINRRNDLYLYLDGTIYGISLEDKSCSEVVSDLTDDMVVVSDSNQMAAWQQAENDIFLMDFGTGKEQKIESSGDDRNRALGFIGEDLVYGTYRTNEVIREASGAVTVPMHTISIQDKKGDILKTYGQQGIYVTHVSIEDNSINMTRIQMNRETNSYTAVEDDQIKNNVMKEATKNTVTTAVTDQKEELVEIALMGTTSPRLIKLLTPKEVLFEGGRNLELTKKEGEKVPLFYVYAKGEIVGIHRKASQAVNDAMGVAGVVVNDGQEYIWQKGNRETRVQMKEIEAVAADEETSSLAACLDALLLYEGTPRNASYLLSKGQTAIRILEDHIEGQVLDLSGCELSAILYYVSERTPVIARVEEGNNVLIVGYDEKNTILMDPQTGTVYRKGMNDCTEWFKKNGNEFIAYVKTE